MPKKISTAQKEKIKDFLRETPPSEYTISELVKKYGVSERSIYYIKNNLAQAGELYSDDRAINPVVLPEAHSQEDPSRMVPNQKKYPSSDEIDEHIKTEVRTIVKPPLTTVYTRQSKLKDELETLRKATRKRDMEYEQQNKKIRAKFTRLEVSMARENAQPKDMMDKYMDLMVARRLNNNCTSLSRQTGSDITLRDVMTYSIMNRIMEPTPTPPPRPSVRPMMFLIMMRTQGYI